MSANTESEDRALNAAELEMVKGSRPPAIEQQTKDELKALAHRLRQAHSRANDIATRQQREMRGKVEPRGAQLATDATGSIAKTQALFDAIRRIDEELSRREEVETGKPSLSELARKALELKMSAQSSAQHPDPGRTAKTGARPKKRIEEFAGGTTRKEIGRVSQANKVAQARKDSGKG
jgi:hypothetical protein